MPERRAGPARGRAAGLRALARLAFELGVACMRLGSYRNCALHPTDESCVFPIRGRGVHADRVLFNKTPSGAG